MAYSMDFRSAVAAEYDKCRSSAQVAARYGCSEAWVRRLIQRRRESNSLAPRAANRSFNLKLDGNDHQVLRQLVHREPKITLHELAKALGNKASVPTVWRAVCALGLREKRARCRSLMEHQASTQS
jgi:transposase